MDIFLVPTGAKSRNFVVMVFRREAVLEALVSTSSTSLLLVFADYGHYILLKNREQVWDWQAVQSVSPRFPLTQNFCDIPIPNPNPIPNPKPNPIPNPKPYP